MLLINIYKVVANVDFMKLKNNRLLLIITKMFFSNRITVETN